MKNKYLLTFAVIVFGIGVSVVQAGPPFSLDSHSPHIMIWTDGWTPLLKFFDNKTLKGSPVFQLDQSGLHKGTKNLCGWPGGQFDPKNSPNMVLGYSDIEGNKYEGCGEGGPVLSTWGDGGTGTAVLYVQVKKKLGSVIVTRHQGKDYYFDLRTIPEDNRKWMEAGDDMSTAGE